MADAYSIFEHRIKRSDKERCGDFHLHEQMGDYLLIAVSDGVSRQPCDYKASETTCTAFADHFRSNPDLEIKERFRTSLHAANDAVRAEKGPCASMMATLSTVVWELGSDSFLFANVGDSRIYQVLGDKAKSLSRDNAEPRKVTGIVEGVKVTRTKFVLTQAVGYPNCRFHAGIGKLDANRRLFLVSDGFYGARPQSFPQDAAALLQASNPEKAFQSMLKEYVPQRRDDLTGVLALLPQ